MMCRIFGLLMLDIGTISFKYFPLFYFHFAEKIRDSITTTGLISKEERTWFLCNFSKLPSTANHKNYTSFLTYRVFHQIQSWWEKNMLPARIFESSLQYNFASIQSQKNIYFIKHFILRNERCAMS